LLAGTYIQADETPVDVQTHDGSGTNHQAYLWQYGTPGASESLCAITSPRSSPDSQTHPFSASQNLHLQLGPQNMGWSDAYQ
jgi:hypothetical protein